MKIPQLINWSITSKCNLNCEFCYKFFHKDISINQKLFILERIYDSGVNRITLTGGEPFLDKDLDVILNECKSNDIFTSIHTNGTISEGFYKYANLANRVSFALDGATKEVNWRMRGCENFFDIVLEKMRYMRKSKKDFSIKTVVTKRNISSIPDMVPLIEELNPSFWSIFQFRPIRKGGENSSLFEIDDIEYRKLIESLTKCQVVLNDLSSYDAAKYPIFLLGGNGVVYTNSQEGDVEIGSIHNESIIDLWNKIISKNTLCKKHLHKYQIIQKSLTQ